MGQSAGLQNRRLQVRDLPFSQQPILKIRRYFVAHWFRALDFRSRCCRFDSDRAASPPFHTPPGFVRLFFKVRGDVNGEHTGLICPLCGFEPHLRDTFGSNENGIHTDCKSVAARLWRFESFCSHPQAPVGELAKPPRFQCGDYGFETRQECQTVVRRGDTSTFNREVAGSSPVFALTE